jgi:hypothetical protein
MARSGPLLSEAQWNKIAPLLPRPPKQRRGASVDREPPCAGRDFVDSAQRGSLAGLGGEIPASLDLLAAAARRGRTGRLVENLADIIWVS